MDWEEKKGRGGEEEWKSLAEDYNECMLLMISSRRAKPFTDPEPRKVSGNIRCNAYITRCNFLIGVM